MGVNFAYGEGATGFVASATANTQLYNSSTSVGVGWLSDGVFTDGSGVELTRAWSMIANSTRPAVTLFDDQRVWSAMVRWQRNFYP